MNQPTHLALKNLAGKLNVTIRIFTSNSTSKLYLAGFEDFTQLYKQRVSNTGDKESDNYFNNLVYKYLDVYGDNIGFTEDPEKQIWLKQGKDHYQLISYYKMGSFEYKINKSSNGDIQETETNYANTKVYLNNSEKLITHKDLLNKLKEQNNKNNVYVNTFESIIKERYKGIFQPKDKKYKRDLIKNLIEEFIRSVEGGNSKTSVDGIMDKVNFDYEDQETADQIGGAIESDYRNYLNLFRENKVNINESVDRSIEYYISEAPNIIKGIQPSFLGLKDVGSNYNFTNIKLLLKGIYDSISNVNYPKETETPPRPNHGAVNHMIKQYYFIVIF